MALQRWRQQLLEDTDDSGDSDCDNGRIQEMFHDLIRPVPTVRGGSVPGKRPNLPRDRLAGHERIMRDYFDPHPIFDESMFRRRFRMRLSQRAKLCHD
jgi:hypothetical protein